MFIVILSFSYIVVILGSYIVEETALKYFSEGLTNLNEGNLNDSLPFLRAAVRLQPTSRYLIELGKVEFLQGFQEKALNRFRAAISRNQSTTVEISGFLFESNVNIEALNVNSDSFDFPLIKEISLESRYTIKDFRRVWNQNRNAPFIIRDIFSFLQTNITEFVGLDRLKDKIYKTEFYPQNLLTRPTKIFKRTLKEALEFLEYPEGAFLSVDASEPGTIVSDLFY